MLIEDVLRDAIEYNEIELQAICLYAINVDKKDQSRSAKELNEYFIKERRQEMTNKINEFMEKLNMKRFRGVYEVFDGQLTHYVYADTKEQSMYLVKGISAEIMLDDDELYVNGATRKIKDLIKGKQTPYIIGGN